MASDAGGTAWIDFRGDFSEVRRDAEREGSRAGDSFGQRFTVDAAGRLRNERGQFASAGTEAGEAFGDGASQGAESEGGGGISQWLGGLGGSMGTAAAAGGLAIGVAIGGAAVVGLQQAIDEEGTINLLQARLGAGSPLAEDAGRAAGALYRNGFGESLEEAGSAISLLIQSGVISEDEGTATEMETLGAKALDVATIFEQDLGGVTEAVGQLLRTGLVADADTAFDFITRGLQNGVDRGGDFLDTLAQSSGTLAQFGLDGATGVGLIQQAMDEGAPSADFLIGSLEELAGNAGDSIDVFESLGLNGEEMARRLTGGGPEAAQGLDMLLDALRATEDPAARSTALVGLFGEEATALSAALLAVDPSEAVSGLGNLEGALQRASDEAASGAGAKFETFKRRVLGGLSDFMGRNVLPGLTSLGEGALDLFGKIRTAWNEGGISGVMSTLGGMWEKVWPVLQAKGRAFFERVRTWIVTEGPGVAAKIGDGLYKAGDWLIQNWPVFAAKMGDFYGRVANWVAEVGAPWLGEQAMQLGPKLWQWIQDAWPPAAQAMARFWGQVLEWLGTTAVPWLLQKGNDLRAALTDWAITDAAPALLRGLGSAKDSLEEWINQTAIPWMKTKAGEWFGKLKEGAEEKAVQLQVWFRGLPAQIIEWTSTLAGTLVQTGKDAIGGFITGIGDMLPDLEAIITGLGNMVPDWVKRALGIKSPSRVFMGIGENVMDGFIGGVESKTGHVKDAMQSMARNGGKWFENGITGGWNYLPVGTVLEDGSTVTQPWAPNSPHQSMSTAPVRQAVSASSLPYIAGTRTASSSRTVNIYSQATDLNGLAADGAFHLRRMGLV